MAVRTQEELINQFNQDSYKVDDKIKNYYSILTEHLLGIKDHNEYLSDSKNDYSSSSVFIYKPLMIKNEISKINR